MSRHLQPWLLVCLAVAACWGASACSSRGPAESAYPRLDSPRTIAVMSVPGDTTDETWRDLRLGFGLAALVTEELQATGRFVLVEGKPEIREKLKSLRQSTWTSGVADPDPAFLGRIGADLGVQAVAYGSVRSFSSPKSRAFVGPLGVRTNRVEIAVQVCLRDLVLTRSFCETGEGTATTQANEAFFEYKTDGVVFDRTTVGAATAQAVHEAVAALMGNR